MKGKKTKDKLTVLKYLMKFQKEQKNIRQNQVRVVIEQVSAMPGQGVTSMFNFGQSFGVLKGMCSCNAITDVFC